MDVGETEVTTTVAVGQAFVVDPELLQDRRVQVVGRWNRACDSRFALPWEISTMKAGRSWFSEPMP